MQWNQKLIILKRASSLINIRSIKKEQEKNKLLAWGMKGAVIIYSEY